MEKILEILTKIRPELNFTESNNYIKDGMLDSLDIIHLVSDLCDVFNISIEGYDIIPENFENTNTIIALIKKYGGTV